MTDKTGSHHSHGEYPASRTSGGDGDTVQITTEGSQIVVTSTSASQIVISTTGDCEVQIEVRGDGLDRTVYYCWYDDFGRRICSKDRDDKDKDKNK
ncbi:MAG: hypothetical protein LC746_14285 [Acidobacteria bacterium]|nr:hypothetical protein [Acidobacteriota bacterium]